MLHDEEEAMSDDVVIKAITGLMLKQRSIIKEQEIFSDQQRLLSDQQRLLAEQQEVLVEGQNAIFLALERQGTALQRQGTALQRQGAALDVQIKSSDRQGTAMMDQLEIMGDLKKAMEQFAGTSTDTRIRLSKVEETLSRVVSDLEAIKNAS